MNIAKLSIERPLNTWLIVVICLLGGIWGFNTVGKLEDPAFTIPNAIINTPYPGATAVEVEEEVTERLERAIQEMEQIDVIKSKSLPGRSEIQVEVHSSYRSHELPQIWDELRNKINDAQGDLPEGVLGSQVNDDFGEVYGLFYAVTADGLTTREIRDISTFLQRELLAVPGVARVTTAGEREETIYIDISNERLTTLGIPINQVINTIQTENAVENAGSLRVGERQVRLVARSDIDSTALIEAIRIGRPGTTEQVSLMDIATVYREPSDQPNQLIRYNGEDAFTLGIAGAANDNIIEVGEAVEARMEELKSRLPLGVELHPLYEQHHVVNDAINDFLLNLAMSVAIVIGVLCLAMGWRIGVVVGSTLLLTVLGTLLFMGLLNIEMERISLGALIIALGLLVDDAMIAVETMIYRLEKGDGRHQAASYAWRTIAFPMLSGTLITVAGFIPIGLNNSNAGEFTFSLFVVIAVSLLVSWFVAVLYSPLLGVTFLPKNLGHKHKGPGIAMRMFQTALRGAMRARWLVLVVIVAGFVASVYSLRFVEQQFFPNSDSTELLVNMTLPQNASIEETSAQLQAMETHLKDHDGVAYWSTYVGRSALRFLLTSEPATPSANFGQIVIQTTGLEARDKLRDELRKVAAEEFPGTDVLVKLLAIGPPVGRPVQYRLSGPDIAKVRDLGRELTAIVASDDRLESIAMDWNAPARVIKVDILQDKARQLNLTARDISIALNTIYNGKGVTNLRDQTYLIDIIARGDRTTSESIDTLFNLQLSTADGGTIPLSSVADFKFETEQPVVIQRNRMPTVTVEAALATKDQPATIVKALKQQIEEFDTALPAGYHVEVGGSVEKSAESQGPIAAVAPMMILIIITLVMVQMQSFRLAFIVLSVAPLGLIGVVIALITAKAPMGFVAILGILALSGILIRNSIILVDRIEALRKQGMAAWDAVFEATVTRARPIVLTAAAASLALIPISRQVFWGPMAYALMGGIIVGTVITLIFVPAQYLIVFRIKRDAK